MISSQYDIYIYTKPAILLMTRSFIIISTHTSIYNTLDFVGKNHENNMTNFESNYWEVLSWVLYKTRLWTRDHSKLFGITNSSLWAVIWLTSSSRTMNKTIYEIYVMTSSNGNIFRVNGHLCGPGEFPTQRPVTRSFDVFFDLRLNKRLSKQSWRWWFETL